MNSFARLAAAPLDLQNLADEWPLVWLFKLPPLANIVVAGAYRGQVMDLLATVYDDFDRLIGFEPQADARAAALERLAARKHEGGRIGGGPVIEPYALGIEDGEGMMIDAESIFASFLYSNSGPRTNEARVGHFEMRDTTSAFLGLELDRIDLLLLNIEGYEWLLLPYLIDDGWFSSGRIRRLALQVHWGFGLDHTLERITGEIERTHKRVFDEIPSWGYWQWSGPE